MAKTILGVDIGYDNLKLALIHGNAVKKTVSVAMPKNLMRDGNIVSNQSMGELIRDTMKKAGIRASNAAIVLPNESVYVKNVEMPRMTAEQLAYNLPFEFNDYITDELRDYVFDYAMLDDETAAPEDGEGSSSTMELLAVGMPRHALEELEAILRKAGLRMVMAAPALCAFIALIRERQKDPDWSAQEECVIDLGYQSIRMYMFRKDRHMATRVLELGLSGLDEVVAEAYNVDIHLAHTYLTSNYESCQNRPECLNAYDNIAVELMRAVNFYNFSNPDSQLNDVWLCGGGAALEPLRAAIGEALNMEVHSAAELIRGGESIEDCNTFLQAIGIAMS